MSEPLLHTLTLFGAFWVAVLGYAANSRDGRHAARFVGGLALGAAASHVGWALLHPRAIAAQPALVLDPSSGYTVLALPLGLLATAPWRARGGRRIHELAASLGALPPAIAVARIGCWISGCCHGTPTSLPWGVVVPGEPRPVHPAPIYEGLAWLVVFAGLRRLDPVWIGPGFLMAFGALRLLLEPLRARAPLGPPAVAPAWLAAGWIVAGLLLSPPGRALLGSRPAPGRTTPSACRTRPRRSPRAGRTPSAS